MAQVKPYSLFTDFDINLFKAGKHYRLYEKFGSHIVTVDSIEGTYFAVWAPTAKQVSVIGDFNYWIEGEHQLNVRWDSSGIWEGFIPLVGKGNIYKYKIQSNNNDIKTEKADPYARRCEHPPKTASVVWDDNYKWKDKAWMKKRKKHNALDAPYSVYEVHLGSWKRNVEENRFLSYYELADELVTYVKDMNFTHVELMPIMEYPYDPSWGYQLTGYFAPTSRFGYPEEFKYLVDKLHQNDIGIILDWVPSHFPEDAHGLGFFDGSNLYEHPDPRKGYHQDWKSLIFNYGRNEVKSFLISNAIFWLDQYHADGLRVDAVASMLFLDYSREDGEWEPNIYGGRENLEAIAFLKELNQEVYASFPDVQTIAEESTAFPGVSKPVFLGGLGFGMKWMMGWMHDTLDYSREDGEWEPNIYGGRENLDAIAFLKELNQEVYASFPDVQTIAEESTAFPGVSKPVFLGGLGFGMKWMMGWMHDTLEYFGKDPIYRKHHQNDITFSLAYAFSENFMLPLSHDEVVYGKNSIIGRMPGDEWQRFANLRLLYGYMFTHPGTKLLFMGSEFGQYNEWDFQGSLDWNVLEFEPHKNFQHYFKDLNNFYKTHPALFEIAFTDKGFEWISYDDHENCVISYIRKGHKKEESLIIVCNLTPTVREHYRIGVPDQCKLKEVFNSDAKKYGGSGVLNTKQVASTKTPWHGNDFSIVITLPPLGFAAFQIKP